MAKGVLNLNVQFKWENVNTEYRSGFYLLGFRISLSELFLVR